MDIEIDKYLGIDTLYEGEYRSSGSKFYAFLFPVKSVEDYDTKIKEYKLEYADATHVCSACVIGLDRTYQRCSDDGEPSNSSGRPILNAMLSADITYVGCVVVRYYGGKKLGIPGLIEAYGGAAIDAIKNATISELTLMEDVTCTVDPSISYLLYNLLSRSVGVTYETTPNGEFRLYLPKSMTTDLLKRLKKIPSLKILSKNV